MKINLNRAVRKALMKKKIQIKLSTDMIYLENIDFVF